MKQRARGIRFSLIFSIVAMLAAIPTLLISQPASAATYPTYTYGSDGSFTVSGGSLSKFLTSGSFEATYNSSVNTWDADVKAVSGSSCPGDNVSIQIVANNVTEPGVTSTVTQVIAMCSADGSAIKIGSVNYSDEKQYWTDGKVKVVKSSTTTPGGPGSAKPPGIDGEELYRFHTEKDATGKYILACVGMFKQFSGIGAPGTELDGCVEFAEGSAAGEDPLLTWSKTLNVANPSLYGCSGAGSKPYTFTITAENPPTLNETGSVPATLTVKPASSTSNCTDLELKGSLAGIAIEIMDGDDLDSLIGLPFAVSAESKCQVEGGLGWILCPLLNTLSSLNDNAWNTVIEDFLIVPAISTDTSEDNGLYQAWVVMRNISNVLFVIAFLFIIYSQTTSMGVTNYGIKKMLPRLIVGAILVNTSYWLAAAAVDASNIIGASIYSVLGNISDGIASVPADGAPQNWMGVTALILAGGAGIVMVGLATLLPLIVTAAFLILGLVVTLAFRHAVLLILIVAAPFAAIAYMLPNTDKVSRSWWSLFKLLLILYPLIAFVVGVSTLAGTVIFNAAEGNVFLQLVGIAAPALGILGIPMLVKATSGVLGRFGFQNPFGGAISSVKNRAQDVGGRLDKRRAAYGANENKNRFGRSFARINSASRSLRRGYIDKQKEQAFDSQIEAGAIGSETGRKWNNKAGAAQQQLTSVKADVEVEELKTNQELHLNAAVDNLRLAGAKEEQEALEKQAMAGQAGDGVTPEIAQAMQAAADEKFIQSLRGDSADREVRSSQFAKLNEKEDGDGGEYTQNAQLLQKRAAGISDNKERVVAGAIALADKEKAEAITNRIAMMEDKYKANELVGKAKADLISAHENGDSVGARAATQVLARNTGSAGVAKLEEAVEKIDQNRAQATGDTAEKMDSVMEGVKYDLTASGLKGKSRVLDIYATNKENASFEAIRNDSTITSGLNQAELAGQSQATLKHWAENNILKPEQAQAVMASYEKGTLPLDDNKKEIFINKARQVSAPSTPNDKASPVSSQSNSNVSDGNLNISHAPPDSTTTPPSGPRLRGGEVTTPSGIIIPKDMEK